MNNKPRRNGNKKQYQQNRNTSYYKSRVSAKPKPETSLFADRAKKRQSSNYKLAMILLAVLMLVFAGFIALGLCCVSIFGPFGATTENTGDSQNNYDVSNPDSSDFTPIPTDSNNPNNVDISQIFSNYNGVYLDVQKIESLESLQDFIDNIKSKGVNAVNIDIKTENGVVPYHINGQTDSVMNGAEQISLEITDIINLLHENELYVSGTIACFKDNLAGSAFVGYALHSSSTSRLWQDGDGSCWLNAYSDGAQNYIKGIIEDSVKFGFDEIILSWFYFPNVSNEKSLMYGDEENVKSKSEAVKDFVAEQMRVLVNAAPNVKFGLYIPVRYFLELPNKTMGLNAEDLGDWCNFFATSFVLSEVPPGSKINGATISNPAGSPYETTKSLGGHFKYISDFHNFRPYISVSEQQKQALFECNLTVWQLINDDNDY